MNFFNRILNFIFKQQNQKLDFIIKQLEIMAKSNAELKAEFQAVTAEIKDSIGNVAADVDRLIAGTNPQGGLTEAEVEEQLDELRTISAALKDAAAKVGEPPVEGEPI